jgi:hypothetical protein
LSFRRRSRGTCLSSPSEHSSRTRSLCSRDGRRRPSLHDHFYFASSASRSHFPVVAPAS